MHSAVIAEQSKPLSAFMHGQFSEAQLRVALLEHVDVPTFKRFLEYVYLRGYTDPLAGVWDKGDEAGIASEGASQDVDNHEPDWPEDEVSISYVLDQRPGLAIISVCGVHSQR